MRTHGRRTRIHKRTLPNSQRAWSKTGLESGAGQDSAMDKLFNRKGGTIGSGSQMLHTLYVKTFLRQSPKSNTLRTFGALRRNFQPEETHGQGGSKRLRVHYPQGRAQ
jgi:hypothetical protein